MRCDVTQLCDVYFWKAKKDPEKYQKFFKGYSYFLKAACCKVCFELLRD